MLLLPVQEFCVEDYLVEKGLTNYWGYNPIDFFAPESSYGTSSAPGCQVAEFETMVRELHKAGIEVLLDISFGHTAEGNELGPTMCFRGIDNRTYYCLGGGPYESRRRYVGQGRAANALNVRHPQVARLIMDSLRYWVETMHVDGFRVDLASFLGADGCGFGPESPFFHAVAQDPVLTRAKFISEPWDRRRPAPPAFPIDWAETNVRFRDTARRFARGDEWQAGEMAYRLTGSADLFGKDGRSAYLGVNVVTSHDGSTLADLVSYSVRRNQSNLEDNLDGEADEASWNCGIEGDARDPEVLRLRDRMARNHVCHLLFSLGTPMLLGGDEMLRTQRGNNNAYCQDNELSWIDWAPSRRRSDFLAFVRKAIAFRKAHPALLRRTAHSMQWFDCSLGTPDWHSPGLRTLALLPSVSVAPKCHDGRRRRIRGPPPATAARPEKNTGGPRSSGKKKRRSWMCRSGEEDPGIRGHRRQNLFGATGNEVLLGGDEPIFLIFHAAESQCNVRLPPPPRHGLAWRRVVDTSLEPGLDFAEPGQETPLEPSDAYLANGRSTVVLIAG